MLHSLHWMGMRTWNKIRTKIGTLCERSSVPLRVNEHMQLSVIVATQGHGHCLSCYKPESLALFYVLFEGPGFLNAELN